MVWKILEAPTLFAWTNAGEKIYRIADRRRKMKGRSTSLTSIAITPVTSKGIRTDVKVKYDRDNKTNTLETRYEGDDAGRKQYMVGKWLQFHMADDKPIMDQVHEYENLVANVLSEGMKMCDILQANMLLEKFPPSWSEYRNQTQEKRSESSGS
ncbi:hypothetical protein Sango_2428200 [Sesamum angolense]|uniref:Uncharacterized protein n=1 Tax=Sesamum angolense TaxID=2727404 RepID=A0AAE1W7J9_9LAMI|nr:hypothetical protein Sango_2428200 [Sesamum angolense]